jgi:pyridinium-3,5-bisthiocarboxylic acid mononucleotide nickel chelatase
LRAANLEVIVPHSHNHRHLSDILEIINTSSLSEKVKQTASSIFQLLAEAESRVHGEPVEHVHFHEVGALDSIVDIVGAAIGLDALGIEKLFASPLPYGSGTINSDHGLLPLPAPATLEVLRLINAPLTPSSADVELVTPTGAAILGSMATFSRPNLVMTHIGIGAGKRDLEWPNILRLMIGNVPEADKSEMVQLETNIDDMNPQFFGYLMDKLFASGARDVFMTPIHMKKNRPGVLLGVIAFRKDEGTLAELLLRETTTLGLRVQPIGRYEASREFRPLDTKFGKVTVKAKILDGKVIHATPEYDDCVRLANENKVSLLEIYQAINHVLIIE